MVRLNPGAFFPEESFAQLKIEDLIQLLGPTDLSSMKEEFMEAVRTNRVETIPVSDLVLSLLLNNENGTACDVTQSLYAVLDSQSSGLARYQWQNTLTEVIPYAVVMGKWDYLDQFITRSMVDAAVACELLTLAAHVCLAKELYQQAGLYLQAAKVLAAEDPRILTGAIEDLMQFAEARHGGDEEVAITDFDNIYKPTVPTPPDDEATADRKSEFVEICKRLRHWQLQFGAQEDDEPWSKPEDLAFIFQRFRPDGAEIALFCEETGCPTIAVRLLDVFRATSSKYNKEDDAYFVVRDPQAASDFELLSLASSYFSALTHVAVASDPEIGMSAYFSAPPTIAIKRGSEAPTDSSDFQIGVNEALHDYFQQFPLDNSGAMLLREALYTMACDYTLMHYVLWPEVRTRFEPGHNYVDPYATYFELWKRGVDLRFDSDGGAVLYVTE